MLKIIIIIIYNTKTNTNNNNNINTTTNNNNNKNNKNNNITNINILIIKQTYYRLTSFYTQSYRSKCRKRNFLFGITLSTSQFKDTKLNKN